MHGGRYGRRRAATARGGGVLRRPLRHRTSWQLRTRAARRARTDTTGHRDDHGHRSRPRRHCRRSAEARRLRLHHEALRPQRLDDRHLECAPPPAARSRAPRGSRVSAPARVRGDPQPAEPRCRVSRRRHGRSSRARRLLHRGHCDCTRVAGGAGGAPAIGGAAARHGQDRRRRPNPAQDREC